MQDHELPDPWWKEGGYLTGTVPGIERSSVVLVQRRSWLEFI